MRNERIQGALIASAVAVMFASGAALAEEKPKAKSNVVKCIGVNECKGKGACSAAGNACNGQNACKGKGWIETTPDECKAKKGKIASEK